MNIKTGKSSNKSHGFSLLEMAVVITIIGVVAYGVISVTTAQVESNRIQETKNKLARIDEAITVYFKTYGYLPCPGLPSAASNNLFLYRELSAPPSTTYPSHYDNNTTSSSATTCSHGTTPNSGNLHRASGSSALPDIYAGIIPARSLGLSDDYMHDGWGNRISYIVSRYCLTATNWQKPGDTYVNKFKCTENALTNGTVMSPNTTNGGRITINSSVSPITIATNVAYAIISHGKNSVGAYNRDGVKIQDLSGAGSAAERANGNLNGSGTDVGLYDITNTYYDMPINNGTAGNYFDDIIRWRTPMQIFYDAR